MAGARTNHPWWQLHRAGFRQQRRQLPCGLRSTRGDFCEVCMTTFVDRLKEGRPLMGLWQALACPYSADICARLGFDWLLFDGEHSPNTAQTLLGQLQAVAPHEVEPIARVPSGDPVVIKQYLDLGFRTILVPMVDSAAQATAVVAATRYPPRGIR